MNNALLAGLFASIPTASATWFIARRKSSGSVATSDAATLWAESQEMRKELRDEVVDLRKQLIQTRERLEKAEKETIISHRKIQALVTEIRELEKKIQSVGDKT